jgi:hypothetical protein
MIEVTPFGRLIAESSASAGVSPDEPPFGSAGVGFINVNSAPQ